MLSPALAPEASVTPATDTARDGAKKMAVQAHYILLKRDRLLEALRLYPEQMLTWSRRQRLTETQNSTGIGTDDESS
ncbi:hypothetical protein [Mesorhizobium sp. M0870]|uniref:hypothetical protein n=1 Tax=Mesorhizobium sp. M0870 TaxID=2957016 RepID=UPI0033375D8D